MSGFEEVRFYPLRSSSGEGVETGVTGVTGVVSKSEPHTVAESERL